MNKEQFKAAFSMQMRNDDSDACFLLLEKDMIHRQSLSYLMEKAEYICSEFMLHILIDRSDKETGFTIAYKDITDSELCAYKLRKLMDLSDTETFKKGYLVERIRLIGHKVIFDLGPFRLESHNYEFTKTDAPAVLEMTYDIKKQEFTDCDFDIISYAWRSLRSNSSPVHYIDCASHETISEIIQDIDKLHVSKLRKERIKDSFRNILLADDVSSGIQIAEKLRKV